MIGALLDNRYELIEKIGSGGMSEVYKAKCTLLNRSVAIKILKDEFKNDEEFLKRFNVESQAAAGLSHNNIVSVYDVGVQGELHYIVMEYVEGITLKAFLKENGPLPWEQAIDFATQIASAMQHAHRKGIVHRDIKPQNILVTKDNVLKVTDFGIARAVSSFTMKVDDNSMGTAHYCSPEQARGGYTDEKSDIYSLGVVMYEMVTGRLPFEGDSSVSVALKHIQEEPVSPKELIHSLPSDVEHIILKAMKKASADRFATASEMLIELSMIKQDGKYTPVKNDDASETKVFSTKEVKEKITESEGEKSVSLQKRKEVKKNTKKEDRNAVIAALVSSFLVVGIISVLAISFMFPSVLPWNREKTEIKAPNLVGFTLEKAIEEYPDLNIKKSGEEYSAEHEEGVILSQTPEEKTKLKSPFTIKVVVSMGNESVKVPKIKNLEYREAIIKLEKENILYTIEYEESTEIPENIVMDVFPKEGTSVKANLDVVTLTVSAGNSQSYIVPNVLGKDEEEAKSLITSKGFVVDVEHIDSEQAKGVVVRQSIAGGTQLAEKTSITISVSTGKKPVEETPGNTVTDNPNSSGTDTPSGNDNKPTTPSNNDTGWF
ncbi:MAG: Stk1 family PASTA domain-containing Ser/Thr kinase [Clostridia bacterium]|nr:Stk1 family PASTA domain-containing Ser/Thr kinase [Clostridia bacterium]